MYCAIITLMRWLLCYDMPLIFDAVEMLTPIAATRQMPCRTRCLPREFDTDAADALLMPAVC